MSRFLITSALPYVNGVKHLGNLVGSMLPADVHARFRRMQGHDVLFLCATDEHGTPTELAALEAGQTPAEFCAKWHALQKQHYEGFHLSFDHFGRSSSAQNRALTQRFAQTLWEQGFLEERVTRQVYSHADKRFLPDRYVIGTCPHCGYDRARGDQCENCTRVLDPPDLIKPRSAISGSPDIEIRDSTHLFLRQSLFAERLRAWIGAKESTWPLLVTSIAMKWLDEGLQDRGITRDLEWGVPVNAHEWGPNPQGARANAEALASKVFYVWFDAPIEYIGATWEWADAKASAEGRGAARAEEWERWWRTPGADDVTYVQFMGKDNVPFHTVGFPCTLIGLNETRVDAGWTLANNAPWKLVDRLKGFNWLNYYGGKFSTSQKRGVFVDSALEIMPADVWRWRLVASAPESADSSFTWEDFQHGVNADLANVLGNFVNRITKFCESRFEGRVPGEGENGPVEEKLFADVDARLAELTAQHEAMEFRKAAAETRALWALGNEYLQNAAPWTAIKTDAARAAVGVRVGLNLCILFAEIAAPFMPDSAARIRAAFGLMGAPHWPSGPSALLLDRLTRGAAIATPPVLFRKIEDADVAAWKERFGGAEAQGEGETQVT